MGGQNCINCVNENASTNDMYFCHLGFDVVMLLNEG